MWWSRCRLGLSDSCVFALALVGGGCGCSAWWLVSCAIRDGQLLLRFCMLCVTPFQFSPVLL